MAKSFNAGYTGPSKANTSGGRTLTTHGIATTKGTATRRKRAALTPYERPKYPHHLTNHDQY